MLIQHILFSFADSVGKLYTFDHNDTVPAGSTLRLSCELGESNSLTWYFGDGAILASYVHCIESVYDPSKFAGRIKSKCNNKSHKSSLIIKPVRPSDGDFSIVCKTDEHVSMINITVVSKY